jgi:release factor glutamine methyltransferase
MKRPNNISKNDFQLLQKKYSNMDLIIKKINDGYPIQYLIGNVNFYGYDIKVNPNVLIPRFETESLVEKTIEYIKKLKLEYGSVLDIGTGSGCISVALKKEIDTLSITAIDKSRKAIKVAKNNAKYNKIEVNNICKDVYKFNLINTYDIIISNPPYLTMGDDVSFETKYEPKEALYVKSEPLEYYKQIFKIASKSLNKKGLIALEIDENEGTNMKKLAKEYFPKAKINLEKDLAGKDRFLFVIYE